MARLEAEVGGLRETEVRLRGAMDTEREGARLAKDALSQEKAEVQDELDRLKVDMEAVAEAQEVLEGRANGKACTVQPYRHGTLCGCGWECTGPVLVYVCVYQLVIKCVISHDNHLPLFLSSSLHRLPPHSSSFLLLPPPPSSSFLLSGVSGSIE